VWHRFLGLSYVTYMSIPKGVVPMFGTVVPTPVLQQGGRASLEVVPGYTDDVWTVSIVEGSFTPADPTTWPAASSKFTPKVSDDLPSLHFDAASGKYFLMAPEPAGGWLFAATGISASITAGGYIIKCGTNLVGADLITPATITADGQTVTLPYVCLEVAANPYVPGTTPVSV